MESETIDYFVGLFEETIDKIHLYLILKHGRDKFDTSDISEGFLGISDDRISFYIEWLIRDGFAEMIDKGKRGVGYKLVAGKGMRLSFTSVSPVYKAEFTFYPGCL